MRVAKWGDSLAVRIPSSVVKGLGLEEGDDIEIRVAGPREFQIAPDRGREEALQRIKAMRLTLPADWKFDRGEANAR